MTVAPTGTSAWRSLLGDISRPRARNMAAMRSTISGSRSMGTFITSAMASRVMSSWVGPRPPHTMTASLRERAMRRACTMRSRLSPTFTWKCESMPAAARCSPIHDELVSTIWPRRSSVPTATTSHRTGHLPGVEQVLGAGDEGQHHARPQPGGGDPPVIGRPGQESEAHGDVLHDGLDLGPVPGGDGDAPAALERAEHAYGDLAHGDEHDREPPEDALAGQGEEGAEDEELVGQRVEKGTGAGG